MTWVKVCGLRRRADVEFAVAAGADAVGFVADPDSVRFVPVAAVAPLARDVAALTVLVTVDLEPADLLDAASKAGVGAVQPHGRGAAAAAAAAAAAGLFVLRPVAVAEVVDLTAVPESEVPLLDTARPGRHGGTGESFDWSLAEGIDRDVVLAGGLHPGNVSAAIRQVRPWGVDASSHLESAPGVKDHARIERFVKEAKNT